MSDNSEQQLKRYVLDSYAVLAYLKQEADYEIVLNRIKETKKGKNRLFMNLFNLGEVLYIVERERGLFAALEVLALIDELPVIMELADRELTLAAAHLKAQYPIAYADCFAVALAQQKGATLISGDPDFEKVAEVEDDRLGIILAIFTAFWSLLCVGFQLLQMTHLFAEKLSLS